MGIYWYNATNERCTMTILQAIKEEQERVYQNLFRDIEISEVNNIIEQIKRDNSFEDR